MNASIRATQKPAVHALGPALLTGLGLMLILALVYFSSGRDPLAFARLGTQFSEMNPAGTEGYDGQFVYYIALDPDPAVVAPFLDVPPYRYQRILLPLTSRLLALGNPVWIPWTIPFTGLVAQIIGTWLVGMLIIAHKARARYAIVYGLWAGFTLAVRLDLPEPLAYALIAGAIYSNHRGWKPVSWVLYGLALFAKEVTILFLAAQLIDYVWRKEWRSAAGLTALGLVPFLLFQLWLWQVFGAPGIGSGGANATPFEIAPLLGFLRIAFTDLTVFLVFLLVFGPFVIVPAIWGVVRWVKDLRTKDLDLTTWFLLMNSLVILYLPFSTFREPGGLLRFSCGLVLAFLLYAAYRGRSRLLNYSMFSLVLNVFLIE